MFLCKEDLNIVSKLMGANIRNFRKFYRAVFQKSNNYARQNEFFEQFWPKYIYIFLFFKQIEFSYL